jgi:hypothetical protein
MKTRASATKEQQHESESDDSPPPLPPPVSVEKLQRQLRRAVKEGRNRPRLFIRIPAMPPNPIPTTTTSIDVSQFDYSKKNRLAHSRSLTMRFPHVSPVESVDEWWLKKKMMTMKQSFKVRRVYLIFESNNANK